jgi:hypothetical protein
MRKSIAIAVLSLLLVLSWFNFSVSQPIADDVLGIDATAPIQKWEYNVVSSRLDGTLTELLNKSGASGWEVSGVVSENRRAHVIMKRAVK